MRFWLTIVIQNAIFVNFKRYFISGFQNVRYTIPDSMVKGKEHIRVTFKALPGNVAGAVYYIRLVKAQKQQ